MKTGISEHSGVAAVPTQKPQQKLKIGFVLAKSFTLSAFALFIDTLRLASDREDKSGRVFADWQVLSDGRNMIRSSCGVEVSATADLIDPKLFDYIVVVGGLLSEKTPVSRDTIRYLQRAAADRTPLIGVCTGTFILAEAGLMKNHQTCVSWLHYRAFRELYPDVNARADHLYNLDAQRGSCAGGASSADIAAVIVRRFIGKEAERNALEVLQLGKARSTTDVQPRNPLSFACDDNRLRAILIFMEGHLEEPLTIPQLATAVGLSRRQLERLFLSNLNISPARAYKQIRVQHAKSLLRQTSAPLIDIALEVGFPNPSHFTREFKSIVGVTPGQFRREA